MSIFCYAYFQAYKDITFSGFAHKTLESFFAKALNLKSKISKVFFVEKNECCNFLNNGIDLKK